MTKLGGSFASVRINQKEVIEFKLKDLVNDIIPSIEYKEEKQIQAKKGYSRFIGKKLSNIPNFNKRILHGRTHYKITRDKLISVITAKGFDKYLDISPHSLNSPNSPHSPHSPNNINKKGELVELGELGDTKTCREISDLLLQGLNAGIEKEDDLVIPISNRLKIEASKVKEVLQKMVHEGVIYKPKLNIVKRL